MRILVLAGLFALLTAAPAIAAREPTPEERTAIVTALTDPGDDAGAQCAADTEFLRIEISTASDTEDAVVEARRDDGCTNDLIVLGITQDADGSELWAPYAWLNRDELGSCQIISSEAVAADLDICDTRPRCVALRATTGTRKALIKAADADKIYGGVLLGRCKGTFYALAGLYYDKEGYTRPLTLFKRKPGGPWKRHSGAGGRPPCAFADTGRIPWTLSDAWKFDPAECP